MCGSAGVDGFNFYYVCSMGSIMQEVALNEVRFFSPIGYYPEERLLGNEFFVDFSVSFPFKNDRADELSNTLNYEELYNLLCRVMKRDRKLLESAAVEILEEAKDSYPFAVKIVVAIRKTTPPFGADHIHTCVTLTYHRP
ncbi:hypothetical protein GCM10017764_00890 [Sphingobacterium griseoflavum]|uniref:Dihydroneopterin aldolase/epimerase domain-containing protein n=2 Tax=Sphingobacterium griseoflavum TaxID=1474952 RepID=A0ABQ3HPG7_9SPHI|nr:hypothetical protein GCM10017764_00890 [Sphingobacterium griseoflavum]